MILDSNRQKKPQRSGARNSPTPAQMGESAFSKRTICCAGARPNALTKCIAHLFFKGIRNHGFKDFDRLK
jgi:hypothetical protein